MAIKIKKKVKKEVVEEVEEVQEEPTLEDEDAFIQASLGFWDWMQKRWVLVAGVAAIIVVGYAGISMYQSHIENQEIERSAALNLALDAYRTPTAEEIEQQKMVLALRGYDVENLFNDVKVFDSSQARDEAMFQASIKVAEEYGDTEIAGEAHLVAAAAAHRLGRSKETLEHIQPAIDNLAVSEDVFALQAKAVALADSGNLDEAVKAYREVEENAPRYYGAFSLMQVGLLLEEKGDFDGAADAFAKLAAKYPESIRTQEAKQRLALLTEDPDAKIEAMKE